MNLGLVNPNDSHAVRRAFQTLQRSLGFGSSPTFAGLTLTGLTATRLVQTNASQGLASVTNLANWIAGTANEVDVADDGDGTITIGIVNPLIVGKGGSGAATLTDHGLLLGSGTDAITPLGVATNGQLPIGSTGLDPVLATLTAGTGISITNAAGSITIAGTVTQYTDEMVDDRVYSLIQNGTGLSWTYDDNANTLTGNVSITQYTDELAQDAVGGMVANSATINLTYTDLTPSLVADLNSTLKSNYDTAYTHSGLITGNPHSVTKSDVGLGSVENTALSTWAGTTNITTLGTIATGVWNGTDIAIADGGTGQGTAQLAINALTAVAAATNEHVLTKDTTTGNAIWKAASGSADTYKVKVDVGATEDYIGAASNDGVLRTTTGLSYTDGGNFVTLGLSHLGIESLVDATADKMMFWDDSESACKWLTASTGLDITGTNLTVSGAFVDRGDPAVYDITEASMTIDGAWHDWDLSAVVPAGAKAVLFGVAIGNTQTTRNLYLRKNGNSNVRNASLVQTLVANLTHRFDLTVACDTNRVIEYYIENLGTWSIGITIRGWWI